MMPFSGVTSHRQPCNAGGQGPKTIKGAQSDANYVSRLLLDCVANVCRGPTNYSYATDAVAWMKYRRVSLLVCGCVYL